MASLQNYGLSLYHFESTAYYRSNYDFYLNFFLKSFNRTDQKLWHVVCRKVVYYECVYTTQFLLIVPLCNAVALHLLFHREPPLPLRTSPETVQFPIADVSL